MASQGITHFIVIHKLDSYSSLSTIYIKCTQFKPCQFTPNHPWGILALLDG